jgi:hypothetical protein
MNTPNLEETLRDSDKRFSIAKCLCNDRIFPKNVASEIGTTEEKNV